MGKRSSRRKNASMLDSDDDDTLRPSSTVISDTAVPEMEVSQGKYLGSGTKLLDECVDALSEKRCTTRERALAAIIDAFTNKLQYQFVEKNCVTLLHPCLNSIKKGSSKEKSLASRAIGLLALTVGCGDKSAEILEESIHPLSQALKSGSESNMSSVLECLAVVTFVGGNDPDMTERSMQIMWQIIHPKLGPNVSASKIAPAVLTVAVSAWSFLLTTVHECKINLKVLQDSISHLSNLLDKDDRFIRIAAGQAIALIFEIGELDTLSVEDRHSSSGLDCEGNSAQEKIAYIRGLKAKILSQVRNLSVEAGGKGSTNKKDLGIQRNLFRDVVEFLEDGYCPKISVKTGGDILQTSTWSQLIQLNFLKCFLGGGFAKHMQENDLLHDVFDFTPKKRQALGNEQLLISGQKLSRKAMIRLPTVKHEASSQRLMKSPNSVVNKARTQFLNKQRLLSQDKNVGHFAFGPGTEEA